MVFNKLLPNILDETMFLKLLLHFVDFFVYADHHFLDLPIICNLCPTSI